MANRARSRPTSRLKVCRGISPDKGGNSARTRWYRFGTDRRTRRGKDTRTQLRAFSGSRTTEFSGREISAANLPVFCRGWFADLYELINSGALQGARADLTPRVSRCALERSQADRSREFACGSDYGCAMHLPLQLSSKRRGGALTIMQIHTGIRCMENTRSRTFIDTISRRYRERERENRLTISRIRVWVRRENYIETYRTINCPREGIGRQTDLKQRTKFLLDWIGARVCAQICFNCSNSNNNWKIVDGYNFIKDFSVASASYKVCFF